LKNRGFEYGVISKCGLVKQVNQDRILINIGEKQLSEFGMFVIADGMGGHDWGEVASTIAISELEKWWNDTLINIIKESDNMWTSIKNSLLTEFNYINYIVTNYKHRNIKMGTTLTVMFIYGDKYIIAHIGDSRIYIRENNKLKQLTKDHTASFRKTRSSTLNDSSINANNKLTQCIGINNIINPYVKVNNITRNNMFLLCSDGLYNYINNKHLENIFITIKRNTKLQEIVTKIYDIVKKNGAGDNVSIIVLRYNKSF
jgi:serine/threonine protein phosphatase PrpC